MTTTRRLRAISWLAIVLIAATVLAPVATRAMAAWSGSQSPWDDICTSLGLKKTTAQSADTSGSDQPAGPASVRMQGECPYCLPSAQPPGPPSQPASVVPTAERGTSRFLFFFISAPHPQHSAPDSIRPRAPPQFA